MRERLALLAVPAVGLAAVDLVVKSLVATPPGLFHQRSHAWIVLSSCVLVVLIAFAGLPSRVLAVASGVLAGGVLGNLGSAVLHHGRVANPLVVARGSEVVAFNLADLWVLGGIALVTTALGALVIRFRDLLPDSTVAVRVVRRLRR